MSSPEQSPGSFYFIGGRGVRLSHTPSMRDLLAEFPPHNYSVGRTIPVSCVDQEELELFRIDCHVERLACGLESSRENVRRALLQSLVPALEESRTAFKRSAPPGLELILLLLVVDEGVDPNFFQGLEEQKYPQQEGIRILVYPRPAPFRCRLDVPWAEVPKLKIAIVEGSGQLRKNPLCKHSSWTQERKPWETLKARLGVDEVVMTSPPSQADDEPAKEFFALEGLVNNLFVVGPCGTIRTASAAPSPLGGVLPGISRGLVVEVCGEAGLRVLEEGASTNTIRSCWKEAFLTNAASLLVPVDEILLLSLAEAQVVMSRDADEPLQVQPARVKLGQENSSLAKRIRKLISQRIRRKG